MLNRVPRAVSSKKHPVPILETKKTPCPAAHSSSLYGRAGIIPALDQLAIKVQHSAAVVNLADNPLDHRKDGRCTGAVVKAACLESRRSRVRTPLWHSSFKETKCFLLAHS